MTLQKNEQRLYDYLKDNSIDNHFSISTKKELANQISISPTTLTKKLNLLQDKNLIIVESKRGHNGGLVIVLNVQKDDDFSHTNENIIQSNRNYAKALREQYYPTYHYQPKTNIQRRTKKEMIEFNAIKDERKKMFNEMNFKLSQKPFPTKGIFDLSDDPEGYFKAYILAKTYDKLCQVHMRVLQRKAQEKSEKCEDDNQKQYYLQQVEFYKKKENQFSRREILGKKFFDTPVFNTFYKLHTKSKDFTNFNMFKYLVHVFTNVSFFTEQGYKGYKIIPQPNYLISDKYLQSYENYHHSIKIALNSDNRQLSNYTARMNCEQEYTNDIILQQLKILYLKDYDNVAYDIDTTFELALDKKEYEFGIRNDKQETLINFVNHVEQETKDMEDYDKQLLNHFTKQLVINDYAPKTITNTYRLSMFPMQRSYVLEQYKINGYTWLEPKDIERVGLIYSDTEFKTLETGQTDFETNVRLGLEFINTSKNTRDYYITRMFGHFTKIDTNIRDIKHILEKYNKQDLIPLTQCGMLDYAKIKGEIDVEQND